MKLFRYDALSRKLHTQESEGSKSSERAENVEVGDLDDGHDYPDGDLGDGGDYLDGDHDDINAEGTKPSERAENVEVGSTSGELRFTTLHN